MKSQNKYTLQEVEKYQSLIEDDIMDMDGVCGMGICEKEDGYHMVIYTTKKNLSNKKWELFDIPIEVEYLGQADAIDW